MQFQRSRSKSKCGLSNVFDFKINCFKNKQSMLFLSKNIKFTKSKTKIENEKSHTGFQRVEPVTSVNIRIAN